MSVMQRGRPRVPPRIVAIGATIRTAGGIAIVQGSADAMFPSMPLATICVAEVDYRLPGREIGRAIARIVEATEAPLPAEASTMDPSADRDVRIASLGAAGERLAEHVRTAGEQAESIGSLTLLGNRRPARDRQPRTNHRSSPEKEASCAEAS